MEIVDLLTKHVNPFKKINFKHANYVFLQTYAQTINLYIMIKTLICVISDV